jgi:hypothetical protein
MRILTLELCWDVVFLSDVGDVQENERAEKVGMLIGQVCRGLLSLSFLVASVTTVGITCLVGVS